MIFDIISCNFIIAFTCFYARRNQGEQTKSCDYRRAYQGTSGARHKPKAVRGAFRRPAARHSEDGERLYQPADRDGVKGAGGAWQDAGSCANRGDGHGIAEKGSNFG